MIGLKWSKNVGPVKISAWTWNLGLKTNKPNLIQNIK